MTTQYEKIETALRQGKCTNMELIHKARTTCPHKRVAEMVDRGWPIIFGIVRRGGRLLRCYWIDAGRCEQCGEWNPPGRAKKFCSASCRAKYHRSGK